MIRGARDLCSSTKCALTAVLKKEPYLPLHISLQERCHDKVFIISSSSTKILISKGRLAEGVSLDWNGNTPCVVFKYYAYNVEIPDIMARSQVNTIKEKKLLKAQNVNIRIIF